jgi:hypothetical protein
MSEDLIQHLWERGGEGRRLGREEIVSALRPRLARGTRALRLQLWFYLALMLVTLVLGGVNIAAYWHHPTMRAVQIALTLVVAGLACYGIRMLADPGLVDRPADSLLGSVRRRLEFLGPRFELWMWMVAVSVAILAFAISSQVDYSIGGYRINKPLVFVGTNVATLLIVYGGLKLSSHAVVRELRATLEDLQDQLLERTAAVDRWKRGWRLWHVALCAVLVIFLLLGLWLAVRAGS